MFLRHVKTYSPAKPLTVRRYWAVLEHFERLFGKKKKYVEAITRSNIEDYKMKRSEETSKRIGHHIASRTINFEVSTLRTFFYYLINERAIPMQNPCARFKLLKDGVVSGAASGRSAGKSSPNGIALTLRHLNT